ncbi:tetratricopeptide-like helical domain-containing protein, partial [Tanacetum coccineum]
LLIGYCDDEKMDDAMLNDAMLNDAMLVYHEMNEKGFKPNWVSYNIMIRSCFKAARFADAHTLLDELFAQGQTLGQVTYSKILHDLFLHYRFEEAFSLFHLLGLLNGFCAEGLLNDEKQLFLEMEENFCLPTDNTYNFLLQGYLKNKCYDDVEMLLHKMEE